MIDLNGMAERMLSVARIREKNNPLANSTVTVDMIKHLAEEVVEVGMAYGDMDNSGTNPFRSELGDVLCMAILICERWSFDVEELLNDTLEKNIARANKTGDKL